MKRLIIIFFLTTIPFFGQNKEYKNAVNLFNSKQYSEANLIIEKLLNKEFGDLSEEKEFYCLQMSMSGYEAWNDYESAYSKAKMYLDFTNNSSKNFFVDKEKAILGAKDYLEKLKLKIPVEDKITRKSTSDSNSRNIDGSDNAVSKVSNINKTASDDKKVTLTVSGTGKTIEEAKNNALRSAIEQAFGAFISSKTEILNDDLVKDEMLSIANGNINKFDVISEVQIPDVGYNCILSAVVSISKLTSFIESKGGSSDLNGSIYSSNLKTKTLEKESEYIAMKNISINLRKYLNACLDYEISVKSEPKVVSDEYVSVNLEMTSKFNNNIELFKKLFLKSLRGISIDLYNVKEYQKLNIPTYNLWIGPVIEEKVKQNGKIKEVEGENLFILRNKKTYDEVLNLFNLNLFAKRFIINNGAGQIDGANLFVEPTQNFESDNNDKVMNDRSMHSTYGYSFEYKKAIREEEKLRGKIKKRVKNLSYSDNLKKYGNVKIIDYDSILDVFLDETSYNNQNNICKQSTWISKDTNPTQKILETETELEKNWFLCSFMNPNKDKYGFLINDNDLRPMLIFLEKFKLNNRIFSIEFEHLISTQELSSVTNYVISTK